MNICIINCDPSPQQLGGIKRVLSTLANEWSRLGHNVFFIGVYVKDINYNNIDSTPQILLPDDTIDTKANEDFLVKTLTENQIDIILNPHVEETEVSYLIQRIAKQTGTKLISALHFQPLHSLKETEAFLIKSPCSRSIRSYLSAIKWIFLDRPKYLRFIKDKYNRIIDDSEYFVLLSKRYIPEIEEIIGYKTHKLKAINNPIIFKQDETIVSDNKENLIVWCGRLGTGFKRTDIMLKIWKEIEDSFPNWKCVIIGGGDKDYWSEYANRMGLRNVYFTGFTDPKPYYRKGKLFCLTSTSEGWGLVILEAMAFGCVPLAFNSSQSIYDIITDEENGYIINAFDMKDYVEKLKHLMSDESCRDKMATNSFKTLCDYPLDRIAKEWLDLFSTTISHKQHKL